LAVKSDSNNEDDIKISGIDCIYSISELNTTILSSEFENKNNTVIEIYVNRTKINYTKEYSFPSKGKYKIKYILHDELYLDNMFKNIDSVQSIELKNSSNSTIKIISMKSTFEGCKNLESVLFTESFDTSDLKSTSKLFYNSGIKELNLNKFDTKNVEDMSYMFSHCESLTSLNLDNFSTQNVINMSYIFSDMHNLTNISIINLDTKNVKSMDFMFYNDRLVEILNTSNFNTENVQTMKGMFYNCFNLKEVYPQAFNTKKVTDFDYIFKNCKSIRELNLTSF
jgi:surface protein